MPGSFAIMINPRHAAVSQCTLDSSTYRPPVVSHSLPRQRSPPLSPTRRCTLRQITSHATVPTVWTVNMQQSTLEVRAREERHDVIKFMSTAEETAPAPRCQESNPLRHIRGQRYGLHTSIICPLQHPSFSLPVPSLSFQW